jgi:hypothetical protein
MTHIQHLAHFDAPIDLVFRRGADPELMTRYYAKMRRIWDVEGDPTAVGSTFRFREHLLGRDLEGRVEVIESEPPRRYVCRTTYDNGATVRWEMRSTPSDGGTDVWNDIDYDVPHTLLYRLADALILKRRFVSMLREGDVTFNEIVKAEAASARDVPATPMSA